MIYLWKKDGRVIHHTNIQAAADLDELTKAPDKTVSESEWEEAGGLARVIGSEIVLGKTDGEKEEEEKNEQITTYKDQLQQIDYESGASREVRDVSVGAGTIIDAVRILIPYLAQKLNITLPEGFGGTITSAVDIINLEPPPSSTPEQILDFTVHKALLIISYYDPAINPGLQKMREAELEAVPIRAALAELSA